MGYFSRLAVELLEERTDRETPYLDEEEDTSNKPITNHDLAVAQQEEQYSIWNEQYAKRLVELAAQPKPSTQPAKVYAKK